MRITYSDTDIRYYGRNGLFRGIYGTIYGTICGTVNPLLTTLPPVNKKAPKGLCQNDFIFVRLAFGFTVFLRSNSDRKSLNSAPHSGHAMK